MDSAFCTAWIGIGANLGDPRQTVESAIDAINLLPSSVPLRRSGFYLSAPVDADGDQYVNAVISIQTSLTALQLLRALQKIEHDFGRVRSYHNAPRTLDCDVLLFDDQVIDLPELVVPHPRMHLRAFVLFPLLDINPDIAIPGVGLAQTLRAAVADQVIRKLD